jgi:peptidoglycan hydrolase CwlO-like protein
MKRDSILGILTTICLMVLTWNNSVVNKKINELNQATNSTYLITKGHQRDVDYLRDKVDELEDEISGRAGQIVQLQNIVLHQKEQIAKLEAK